MFSEYQQQRLLLRLNKGLESMCTRLFDFYGSCDDCLHPICCTAASPSLLSNEVSRISQYVGISEKKFKKNYVVKLNLPKIKRRLVEPCPFLKNNRCSIYKKRPQACTTFPFESSIFMGSVRLESITMCPIATQIADDLYEFFEKYKNQVQETIEMKKYMDELEKANQEMQDRIGESLKADDSHENYYMMISILYFVCFCHYKMEGIKNIEEKFEDYQVHEEHLVEVLLREM